ARADVGNAVAAIEGAMAFDYLTAKPARAKALDLNHDGTVTAAEIETFVGTDNATLAAMHPELTAADIAGTKAMARLIGGTDTPARIRRMQFYDLAADGVLPDPSMPAIKLSQFTTLKRILLPGPLDFPINNRWHSLHKGFLLARSRRR